MALRSRFKNAFPLQGILEDDGGVFTGSLKAPGVPAVKAAVNRAFADIQKSRQRFQRHQGVEIHFPMIGYYITHSK